MFAYFQHFRVPGGRINGSEFTINAVVEMNGLKTCTGLGSGKEERSSETGGSSEARLSEVSTMTWVFGDQLLLMYLCRVGS